MTGVQKAKAITYFVFILFGFLGCKSEISLDLADPSFTPLGISTIGGADMTEGGSRLVSVSLNSAATSDLTLDWRVNGQDSGTNFVADSGVVSVTKGQTSVNVNIQSVDDAIYEGLQTFQLVVSNGSASKSTTFTVADNDSAPEVQFTTSSATVAENVGTHNINATLDHAVAYPTTVEFSLSGTAFSGDHGLSSNTFEIPAGTTSFNFSVPITNDYETEGAETLDFEIVNATANSLNIPIDVANKDYTLTISANDSAPVTPTTFDLSNPGSAAGSTNDTTVDVTVAGGSAPDKVCLSETQMTKPASTLETCTGGVGPDNGWHTSIPASFDISGGDGTKTVYLWIADSDGVVSLTPITDTIELDETSPVVAITSPAAGSVVNAGNFNNFVVSGTCSDDITTVNYTATGGDGGSTVCSAGSYSFSLDYTAAANGSVSVDITHIDEAGNSNTESRSFNKSVVMTDPLISIKDQSSNSSLYTNSTLVDLDIVNDVTVGKWCVSQTQSTLPANTATCAGSSWVLTKPTSWTFSAGEGSRTLYVWVATAGDAINPNNGSDTITLDTIVPTIADTTATHTANLGNYTAFTIQGNCSENGQAVKLSGDIVKNLACTGGNWSTTENLSSFLNGTINITVNHSDAAENAAVALPIVITKSVFSADPTSLALADSTANANYAKSTSLDTVTIVDDASATKWCLSETQSTRPLNTSVCNGSSWVTSEPTSFTLSSGDGLKTVYLWTATAADVVSQNSANTTITLDTGIPTVAVANPSSGDDVLYANYKTFPINGTCSDDTRVVTVSNGIDTQTPTCTAGAFSTTLDFTGHLAQATVNVTFDHDDAAGNSAVQKIVPVDIAVDIGTPTLAINDGAPANVGYALDQNVNIVIGGDANATKWCVSESQSTAPANTLAGSCGGGNWDTVEPTTLTLSASDANKTVYVWISDNDDIINSSVVSSSIILDETRPSTITGLSLGATPGNLTNSPTISWSGDSTDTNSILKYQARVIRTSDSNVESTWADFSKGGDISGMGLNQTTQYTVEVKSFDSAGNESLVASVNWTTPVIAPALGITPVTNNNLNITGGSSPGSNTTLTLTNTGNTVSAVLLAPVFSGDTANFEVVTDNCVGNTLAVSATCTIDIRPKAVNNRSYTAGITVSDGAVTSNSAALSGTSSGFTFTDATLALDDQTSGSTTDSNSLAVDAVIGNDATAAKWCLSETQSTQPANTATCAGSAWTGVEPTSWTFSAGEGSRTLYVWVANSDDVINTGPISASINIDTVIPTVAITAPSAVTPIDLSNHHSFTVSGTCSEIGQNVSISNTATATPLCGVGGVWSHTFDLSGVANGAVVFDIDHADVAENNATQDSRSYTKNVTMGDPTLAIDDQSTGSTVVSNSLTVDAVIGSDTDAIKWCLSETQNTKPATTAICAGSSWVSTRPTTWTFSAGEGSRTLYLWSAGNGDFINTGVVSTSITIDTVPSTIAFTTAALSTVSDSATLAGTCTEDGTINVSGDVVSKSTACTGGTWSDTFDFSGQAIGTVTVNIDQTDAAGNVSTQVSRDFNKANLIHTLAADTINSYDVDISYAVTSTTDLKTYKWAMAEGATAPANCGSGGDFGNTNLTQSLAGLNSATQYSLRVCFVNTSDAEVESTTVTFTTLAAASSGTALVCSGGGDINTTCNVNDVQAFADSTSIYIPGNLVIQSGGSLTSALTEAIVLDVDGNITVESGGSIAANLSLLKTTTLDIQAGGKIDASGLGHAGGGNGAQSGTGPSPGIGFAGTSADPGGAGHASPGADGRALGGAVTYGDKTAPVDYGSGGGSGDDQDGGNGGGIVKINADTLIVNGELLVKGANGVSSSSDQGGGGSGGSLWLNITNGFSGTGTISAQGGDAGFAGNAGGAGSGSGGRIAIYQTNNNYGFDGTLSVQGGRQGRWAGYGSLYVSLTSLDQICDSGNLATTCTISKAKYFGDTTTISGAGTLVVDGTGKIVSTGLNSSLNFNLTGDLDIAVGGEIRTDERKSIDSLTANNVLVRGTINANITNTTITSFTLFPSGIIDASGLGHWGAKGEALTGDGPSGGLGHSASSADPGGGGHAGAGGAGRVAGGTTIYGSRTAPVDYGSGGGSGDAKNGGNGGGAIKISATAMVVDGIIRSNGFDGEDGGSDHGAGGAGGSIWLEATNSLTGTGTIEAKGGGAPVYDNQVPGGGSGGRIAIYQTNNTYSFNGTIDLDPDAIGSRGAVGTFYLGLTSNDQICDSGNFASTCTVSTTKKIGGDLNITSGNLTINATGSLVGVGSDSTFIFNSAGNLDVLAGGSFSMVAGTSVTNLVATNFNMAGTWNANIADSTIGDANISGTINVDGLGFLGGSSCQDGFGTSPGQGTCNDGGGGAHATNGGNGDASTAGTPAYGSNTAPVTWGSGGGAGGSQIGGAGGGAVKLSITNTLTLSGTISADGINGGVNSDISGGGAGGSIWLAANDITGSGASVTVTGGQSGHSNSGGDGSAGRISVEAVNYSAGVIYDYTSGVGDGSFYTNLTNYLIVCSGGGSVLTTCNVNDQQQLLAGMTVNIPGSLVLQSGGDLTTNRLEAVTLNVTGNVTIESGGKITANLNNLIASTLDVQAGGLIDVTGKGHLGGKVNGANGQGPSPGIGDSNSSGAGGGHAGVGANGVWSTTRLGGQVIYGSKTNPVDYGSGGGAGDELDAGDGGGIIKLTVTDLIVNGSILANGANGAYSGCCDHAGGGSGGSIWIIASNSTSGTGTISIKGGDSYGSGGAGSGGRLAIYQTANTYNFAGTILADRGVNGSIAGEGSYYLGLTSIDQLCDSGNFATTCTISTKKIFGDALSITTGNLTITSTGSLIGEGLDASLTISTTGNIDIQNGGLLEMENTKEITVTNVNTFTVAGNVKANLKDVTVSTFDLQASGVIDVSSRGHLAGTQENESGQGLSPGGGDNNDSAGGGGHASLGGDDSFSGGENLGGPITYGINSAPVEYGSGGGSGEYYDGGHGGGVVKIVAADLALNGSILANGGTAQPGGGCCDHGGGGSGGSIWLTASNSFSGTGSLKSNGGDAAGQYGGTGSGGRIAIVSSSGSYTFNGSLQSIGGTVGNPSGPGSLYLSVVNQDALCTTGDSSTTCTMSSPLYISDINMTGDLIMDSSQSIIGGSTITVGGDFTLKTGRTISSVNNGTLAFNVTGDSTIEAGATINSNISDFTSNTMTMAGEIDVSELGHASYTGTGRGGLGSGGGNPASGGGYGSSGGRGYDNNPGVTYGTESAPTDYGSGGGYDNYVATTGGAGGGAVKLTITDMLTFTGSIKSNGQTYVNYDAGAGSGGSIWINAGSITGAGTLEAKGGNASPGGYLNGSGGAGRIAITMTDALGSYDYSGAVNMLNDFDNGIEEGSFYVSLADNDSICDTGNLSTTCTINSDLTLGGTQNFNGTGFFVLDNNASIKVHGNTSSVGFDLTGGFTTTAGTSITSYSDIAKIHSAGNIVLGGTISAGLPDVNATGDITVNGTISATGKGFLGGAFHDNGKGTGPGLRCANGLNPAGAGGHGGAGGDGHCGSSGGSTYGSVTQPSTKGSGGASDEEGDGGAGGGIVKLVASGNISINALVDANGSPGSASGGGGGAGGSVYIDSDGTCSGASNIEAKGGNSGVTFEAAGGGGGRIHLDCAINSWSGAFDVSGGTATGTSPSPGSAGTTDTTYIP